MYIILHNPLSRNGKSTGIVEKLERSFEKKNESYKTYNILKIQDVNKFMRLLKSSDKVVIVGGDGTLNRIANTIRGIEFSQQLFLYRAGTGNDFGRSYKKRLIEIGKVIKDLPSMQTIGKNEVYMNGCGLGLDGYVGYLVNENQTKKSAFNYLKNALKAFKTFEPMQATVSMDGETKVFKNAWLVSVMNGPYFGGGMKIAPYAKREDDLIDLCIVHRVPRLLLFVIFPTIYLGKHVWFKRYVFYKQVTSVEVTFEKPTYMQVDGEVTVPVSTFSSKR